MYRIAVDPRKSLIEVSLSGQLSEEEAERYVVDVREVFLKNIGTRLSYVMLIDTSAASLQSQDVVESFRRHIATFPKARRIAVVNGHSLVRMQLKRVLDRPYLRFFETGLCARAWLLEQD